MHLGCCFVDLFLHVCDHTLRCSEDEGPTLLFWVDERPEVGEVPEDMGTFKAGAHGGLKIQVESGGMMFLRAKELRHGSEASEEAFACGAVRWGSALFSNAKSDPSLEALEKRFVSFKASEKAAKDALSAAARNVRVAEVARSVPAGSGKRKAARCEATK